MAYFMVWIREDHLDIRHKHCVKISAYSDENCRNEKKHFGNVETDRQTDRQVD